MSIPAFTWPNYAFQNRQQKIKTAQANLKPTCTALVRTLSNNNLQQNPMMQIHVGANENAEQEMSKTFTVNQKRS